MSMSVEEVLARVAELPRDEWGKIQAGIADLMIAELSQAEVGEVGEALAEAEAELQRGEGISSEEARKRLGLT